MCTRTGGEEGGGYTLLYYTRAHEGMGIMGMMGLMGGLMGKGLRDGNRGAELLPDGGNTFTREGKGGYMAGEKGEKGEKGKEEIPRRKRGESNKGGEERKKNPLLVGEVRDFINLQL